MKKIMFLIFLMSFNVMASSLKKEIDVKGMVCSFCAHGIESKFQKMKEVKSVKVDLENGKVYLDLKEKVDEELIKKTIIDSGYNIEKIK